MKKITVEFTFDDSFEAYLPNDNDKLSSILGHNYENYDYKIVDNKLEQLKAKLKELIETELDDDKQQIHILTDSQLNELLTIK